MPAWELPVAGHPLALGVLIPGLVVPALFFTCLALYPMADRRIAGGRAPRGLLPPTPADLANRTAAGVAGVTFYGLLWAAAANDQIAYHLQIPLYTVTWIFRVLVLAGPTLAFGITRVICHALAGRRREEELHGRETGRIVRNPQGGYDEIREPAHRAAALSADPPRPAAARRESLPRATRPHTGQISWLGPCPAQTAARPADPGRRPDAMDRSSLIVAVMPITTLIALFTGITLPFIAGSRPGRSHAGGPRHAQMSGSGPAPPGGRPGRRNPALMTPPPPDTCTSPAPASAYHGYPAETRRWVQEVPIVKKTAKLIYYTSDSWDRREAVVSPGCISREQFETDTRCHDDCPADTRGVRCAQHGYTWEHCPHGEDRCRHGYPAGVIPVPGDRHRPGPAGRLFFATRQAAEDHLYRGERERAGQAAPQAPPIKELRRAMADAHPDRGGTAEQFIQARRRYQTALRARATVTCPPRRPRLTRRRLARNR